MPGSVPAFSAAASASKISSRSFGSVTSASDSLVNVHLVGVSARNFHTPASTTTAASSKAVVLTVPNLFMGSVLRVPSIAVLFNGWDITSYVHLAAGNFRPLSQWYPPLPATYPAAAAQFAEIAAHTRS